MLISIGKGVEKWVLYTLSKITSEAFSRSNTVVESKDLWLNNFPPGMKLETICTQEDT